MQWRGFFRRALLQLSSDLMVAGEKIVRWENKNIAEGTRGPTIGRSSLPAAETLRRRRRREKHDS